MPVVFLSQWNRWNTRGVARGRRRACHLASITGNRVEKKEKKKERTDDLLRRIHRIRRIGTAPPGTVEMKSVINPVIIRN